MEYDVHFQLSGQGPKIIPRRPIRIIFRYKNMKQVEKVVIHFVSVVIAISFTPIRQNFLDGLVVESKKCPRMLSIVRVVTSVSSTSSFMNSVISHGDAACCKALK